jgi:hypothetical protein
MNKYIKYFNYLIKHKWFVFIAGLSIKAPICNLIIHDWSKFLPSEFIPYANYFYGSQISLKSDTIKLYNRIYGTEFPESWTKEYWSGKFDLAWNFHQKRNPHHWQYWVLLEDSGKIKCLDIPDKYIKEMVADWIGAGKAKTGKIEVCEWYYRNKKRIQLSPNTRIKTEEMLKKYE